MRLRTGGHYSFGDFYAYNIFEKSSVGSRSVYLGKDIMGSVRTTTGSAGAVEGRFEYCVFGQPFLGDLSGWMNLGYMSKPFDTITGLYNYGFRDYRPQLARFTTVDPIRDGNNWFLYVNNDPINNWDLWGLKLIARDTENFGPPTPLPDTGVDWGQVGRGAVAVIGGTGTVIKTCAMILKTGGVASVPLASSFKGGLFTIGYGIAEMAVGLQGRSLPSPMELFERVMSR